jgi:hypothetical protein
MDVTDRFKLLTGVSTADFDKIINSAEVKHLLNELNVTNLLEKTAGLFRRYLTIRTDGKIVRLIATSSIRGKVKIIHHIKYPYNSGIDYLRLINIAIIDILYKESIRNKSIPRNIISDINTYLSDLTDESAAILIDYLFKLNVVDLIHIDDPLITQADVENNKFLLPSQALFNLKKLAEERIEINFRPGGIGAREAEDEFDRRNAKLTKECDISYLELENKAILILEKARLINLCSVITQFANLIELEGPCDQYSIEDLKNVIEQLIRILAKSNLCLLINLLKNIV